MLDFYSFGKCWHQKDNAISLERIFLGCSELISFSCRLSFALYLPLYIITRIPDANTVWHEVIHKVTWWQWARTYLAREAAAPANTSLTHQVPPVDQAGQTFLHLAAWQQHWELAKAPGSIPKSEDWKLLEEIVNSEQLLSLVSGKSEV